MTLILISFIAGVLTVLAPCILPLLPVILGGSLSETKNRRRPFIIIASLSVSVFVFTLLLKGTTALISVQPSIWSYISALILAGFGLTLIFPEAWARIVLKIPGHNKPDSWVSKGYSGNSSIWTDILVGAALGPVFTTCSPTFFVILATVLPQSLSAGLLNLAAYIIGLAVVLLLISHIGQRFVDRLEWASNPYGWFKKTLGVLFIILAVLIAFGLDKKIESSLLSSGFFDVTRVEQTIRQKLEGSGDAGQSGMLNPVLTKDDIPVHPYHEIVNPAGFVNSDPFKLADIVGKKVILIDFVTYSCINCIRTFPYLNSWYDKYKDQGLEIVGIHTPEFAFEKDIANVTKAAQQYGLKFPLVLDNNYGTWNAYGNEYWPRKYLIDIHGNIIYDHIGEGSYDETEEKIVAALNERKKFLSEAGTVEAGTSTPPAQLIQTQSPETYFGAMRNEYFGNGNPNTIAEGTLTLPPSLKPNMFYLAGDWKVEKEYAEDLSASSQLSYIFDASNMYLVAQSADGSTIDARILIDGKPITPEQSGADVSNGIVHINTSRLYHLFKNMSAAEHRIDIIFSQPHVRIFTFTFG